MEGSFAHLRGRFGRDNDPLRETGNTGTKAIMSGMRIEKVEGFASQKKGHTERRKMGGKSETEVRKGK